MRNSPKKIKIINTAIIGCGNAAAWIDLNNLKKFRHTFSHMTHIKKILDLNWLRVQTNLKKI